MAISTTVTVSEHVAEKLQTLAHARRQNVNVLLEALINQAWLQANEETKEYIEKTTVSTAEDKFIPRSGSMTEKLWGALGHGTDAELDEIFSHDYDYELSQR